MEKKDTTMARPRRIKKDTDAHYHLMSRTNDRRFLFERGAVRTELVAALRRAADFCGVELKAYVAMSNHFHVVVKVARPEEPVGADELLRRVGVLKGDRAMRELAERWEGLSAAGFDATLKEEQDRLRARMHDISEFVKLFKELFDRDFKRDRKYCGSIWSGRFASTLVQDGEYLARCMRYVVYNPVRPDSSRRRRITAGAGAKTTKYGKFSRGLAPGRGGWGEWCRSGRGRCSATRRSWWRRRLRWGTSSAPEELARIRSVVRALAWAR